MRRVSVLLAVTLLGCAPSTPEVPRVPTESATVTQVPQTMTAWPSEEPTPTKSPEQQAAEAVVAEYFRLKNEIQTDPAKNIEPLRAIVTGSVADQEIPFIEEDRKNNIVQTGKFSYAIQGSQQDTTETVLVTACTDVTGTDVVDLDTGESILDSNRPKIRAWQLKVTQEDEVWKVAHYTTDVAERCDA